MDPQVRDELKSILVNIFEQNSQIQLVSLITPEGLPILTFNRDTENGVSELTDSGILNRYAALAGASASLGDRTLSTFSPEKVRLIHVQGNARDIAIAISPHLISLVVTDPTGSPNLIAEKLNTELKAKL